VAEGHQAAGLGRQGEGGQGVAVHRAGDLGLLEMDCWGPWAHQETVGCPVLGGCRVGEGPDSRVEAEVGSLARLAVGGWEVVGAEG
jgi:hypothetical protein